MLLACEFCARLAALPRVSEVSLMLSDPTHRRVAEGAAEHDKEAPPAAMETPADAAQDAAPKAAPAPVARPASSASQAHDQRRPTGGPQGGQGGPQGGFQPSRQGSGGPRRQGSAGGGGVRSPQTPPSARMQVQPHALTCRISVAVSSVYLQVICTGLAYFRALLVASSSYHSRVMR